MKSEGHPNYKSLQIEIGNDVFYTMSTYRGEKLVMDVDYRTHRAWTGAGNTVDASNKDVMNFNQKFFGLTFTM
jgi:large subunit ribosomal protein L31